MNLYALYGSPPSQSHPSPTQFRSACTLSTTSGQLPFRSHLRRSESAATAACAQHDPHSSGTNWLLVGVTKLCPPIERQSKASGRLSGSVCGGAENCAPAPPRTSLWSRRRRRLAAMLKEIEHSRTRTNAFLPPAFDILQLGGSGWAKVCRQLS